MIKLFKKRKNVDGHRFMLWSALGCFAIVSSLDQISNIQHTEYIFENKRDRMNITLISNPMVMLINFIFGFW